MLGGGGGGSLEEGRRNGLLAIQWGARRWSTWRTCRGEAVLVTASAVGSPAPRRPTPSPCTSCAAVEMLMRDLGGVQLAG